MQGGPTDPPAFSVASACLIKLISIGLSYRKSSDTLSPAQLRQHERSFQHWRSLSRSATGMVLITMSETPQAFVGARLRSCTLTVTQPCRPSAVCYASRLEISTIYPTGTGTRLTCRPLAQCRWILRHIFSRHGWIGHGRNSHMLLAQTECPTCSWLVAQWNF